MNRLILLGIPLHRSTQEIRCEALCVQKRYRLFVCLVFTALRHANTISTYLFLQQFTAVTSCRRSFMRLNTIKSHWFVIKRKKCTPPIVCRYESFYMRKVSDIFLCSITNIKVLFTFWQLPPTIRFQEIFWWYVVIIMFLVYYSFLSIVNIKHVEIPYT